MEMDKKYSPKEIEERWYKIWEENKYFHGTTDETKESYSIMIPPPNVTGILHMGHILNNSIQDTLIRYKRMSGYNTLWMPGTDHAGIATQNKVERKLADEGLKKEDIGREKFVEETWKWKEKHGGLITNQLRKLGASLDWERERFTMDEGLSEAVNEHFVNLYNDGLIYKGEYMVNWCPRCETALADDEVEHEEKKGKIWHIRYPIVGSDRSFVVATTRPETMIGDTGVAVHPEDERYKDLVGMKVRLPLTNREVPIVTDDYVSMNFGTGVVKMTPAHDPNDFEIGKRNNLEIISILTKDGKMNELTGKYQGMDRFAARKEIVKDLEKEGFLVETKEHINNVGHCYRCDTVIEPRVSDQWFVSMKPLAERALKVVKEKEITIQPKRWEKVYYNWLENIRDWCISRQIWWGHRIPCYYGPDNKMFVAKNKDEAMKLAAAHYGEEKPLRQEDDVLDTWFSSALWPFSTLGWPEKTKELEMYYPSAVLVTGADILFFWVARMVMMGLYTLDEIPFKDVYLHGIVRDEKGRKMSKSLGNSPDPLKLIDEYGADAIRFTMLYNTSQGQDVHFSEKLLEMGRNFTNKIWNVSRFVLMNLDGFNIEEVDKDNLKFELVDRWIFSRLNETIKDVSEKLEKFTLDEAAKSVYEFIRGDFCDWYVEMAKGRLYEGSSKEDSDTAKYVLWTVLEKGLKLLHPFMPYITEEIWQKLGTKGDTIMLSEFPKFNEESVDNESIKNFTFIKEIISSIRNIRAEVGVSPGKPVKTYIKTSSTEEKTCVDENRDFLVKLANLEVLTCDNEVEVPSQSSVRVVGKSEVYVSLEGLLNKEVEIKKIETQLEKLKKEVAKVSGKLKNEKFVSKAPEHIIERERRIEQEFLDKIEKLNENLKKFKG